MPDGSPAGDVRDGSFFMCDHCVGKPLTANSRVLVSVTLLRSDNYTGDADLWIRKALSFAQYEQAHPPAAMRPVSAAEVASLLDGTTPIVADVDHIIQTSVQAGVHYRFGRAGCDGKRCLTHYCLRSSPAVYPPYSIDSGPFAIQSFGLRAHVSTLRNSLDATEQLAQMLTRYFRAWYVPNTNHS